MPLDPPPAPLPPGGGVTPSAPPAPLPPVVPTDPTVTIGGVLSPNPTRTLYQVGIYDGKPAYTESSPIEDYFSGDDEGWVLFWNTSVWAFYQYEEGTPNTARWSSASNVATPDLAESWVANSPATGTPTFTIMSVPDAPPAPLPPGTSMDFTDYIRISGTLSPTPETPLIYAGVVNTKAAYTEDGRPFSDYLATVNGWVCVWQTSGSYWELVRYASGSPSANYFRSTDAVATPNLITNWTRGGTATGTPSISLITDKPIPPRAPLPAGGNNSPASPPQPTP